MQHRFDTLISATDVAGNLHQPGLVLVDCRSSLTDPQKGRNDYDAGHIPGAVFANLDSDLAAPVRSATGRHPLPDPERFIQTLRKWGVSNDTQVVAYDDASGGLAARLWWMLRWLGHRDVAVLNGGLAAWLAADGIVEQAEPRPQPGLFEGTADNDRTISTHELSNIMADGFLLVDARDGARFRGEVEPIDPVAGHIPGAVNLPFSKNLDADGLWLDPAALKNVWRGIADSQADGHWAVMCGSGVTACHLALSAEIAGLAPPRLYVGSWSEWTRDSERPVAVDRGP